MVLRSPSHSIYLFKRTKRLILVMIPLMLLYMSFFSSVDSHDNPAEISKNKVQKFKIFRDFKNLKNYFNYPLKCRNFIFSNSHFNPKKKTVKINFEEENFFSSNKFTKNLTKFILEINDDNDEKIPNVIHFLNYNPNLQTPRYICSIESALSHNPDHEIYVYTPAPQNFSDEISAWRMSYPETFKKVHIQEINYDKFFENTPLQIWYEEKKHLKSWWVEQNLGNALRLAVIWKFGGTYLDLDIISVNSLKTISNGKKEPLKRFIAREETEQLNNAALRFPKNDPFVWVLMENFVEKWDGWTWANNGPFCVSRTYKAKCYESLSSKEKSEPLNKYCIDLMILNTKRFYPIHFRETKKMTEEYTNNCELLSNITNESFGVHWWHKGFEKDEKKKINKSKNSLLGKLFEIQCPNVVETFGWEKLNFE